MDAVLLARIQFGFTIGYHILWPAFTIGVSSFIAYLSLLFWRTGKPVYGTLMRFWTRIFALEHLHPHWNREVFPPSVIHDSLAFDYNRGRRRHALATWQSLCAGSAGAGFRVSR
jgi:hypothetical protein